MLRRHTGILLLIGITAVLLAMRVCISMRRLYKPRKKTTTQMQSLEHMLTISTLSLAEKKTITDYIYHDIGSPEDVAILIKRL